MNINSIPIEISALIEDSRNFLSRQNCINCLKNCGLPGIISSNKQINLFWFILQMRNTSKIIDFNPRKQCHRYTIFCAGRLIIVLSWNRDLRGTMILRERHYIIRISVPYNLIIKPSTQR